MERSGVGALKASSPRSRFRIPTARQCLKLLEVLEDLDDVSSVSANLDLAPDLEID